MPFGNRLSETIVVGGQASTAELRELSIAGFRRIIDLRPATEDRGFDEPSSVAAENLEYRQLPIAYAADLTMANVQQFDQWFADPACPLTLVHCASGNRVGALFALRAAWLHGKNVAAALNEGRAAGLKGMEAAERSAIAGSMSTVPLASSSAARVQR